MRVFLIWPEKQGDLDLRILISALERGGHTLLYFVGYTGSETIAPPETVFHSYIDAIAAKPASHVDVSSFPPLGAEVIKKFYRTESIVLTMMNRLFDRVCVDERRRTYYEMLRYWLGVFETYKPEAVIFPNMPHFVFDYIIYDIAHAFCVKTIFFDDTRFPGRLLLLSDLSKGSEAFRKEQKKSAHEQVRLTDLASDIRAYYEPRTDRCYTVLPGYIADQKKKHAVWPTLFPAGNGRERITDFSVFKKAPHYAVTVLKRAWPMVRRKAQEFLLSPFQSNLKKEYERVAQEHDFSKKFVYFPLQKQPERTTSPQGDVFVDQTLALEIVSASLPEGWVIYAKEHPMQWLHFGTGYSSFRYRGFYERMARIPKVMLVPVSTSSYRLINESHAVSAVTGSAGFEAVLRSTPAVIFGTVWYEDCPGVFKAASVIACRAALEKIAHGYKIDQQKIINYLKAFERATIRAYIAPSAGKASGISKTECMERIADAVLKELA